MSGGRGVRVELPYDAIVEAIYATGSLTAACRAVGVDHTTATAHTGFYPVFGARVAEARLAVHRTAERIEQEIACGRTTLAIMNRLRVDYATVKAARARLDRIGA